MNKCHRVLGAAVLVQMAALAGTVVVEPAEGNATPRVVAAVKTMADGDTLLFKKGEYHFFEEGAIAKTLMAGATSWGEKKLVFGFENRSGITIDGGGSTFVWHGNVFPFAFTKCRDITVRSVTCRAFRPSYVELRIERYLDDGSFEFAFNPGVSYTVKDGALLIDTDLGRFDSREKIISVHALERMAIHYLFAANETSRRDRLASTFFNGVAEDLGGGRVRVQNRKQDLRGCLARYSFKVGEPLCFLLNGRERCSLHFAECRGVTVKDVHLQSGDGMGIVSFLNENVTVDGYCVEPRAGDHVSITADCLFVVNNRGLVEVKNSTFSWALDDAINMHGNYLRVASADGMKLELEHIHHAYYNFHPYHIGDTVEFTDPETRDVLATAKVVSVETRERGAAIAVDALPKTLPAGTLVENVTWLPEVRLHDNVFHDVLHVRLSGRGKYTVERNVFRRGICLLVNDLAKYWGEAGRTADMTIRDNTFDSFSARGWGGPFILCEVDGRNGRELKIHRGIRVISNRVRGLPKGVQFANLPCAFEPVVENNIVCDASEPQGVVESPMDAAAKWIGDGTNAAPAFAKTFRIEGKVKSAELAISGLGFYEAHLNGRRIGDRELEPTPTDYTKRVYYTTYDVRALLAVTNELKVLLGNGWYNSARTGVWRFDRAPWRDTPRLLADLAVTFADGSVRHIVSDETWHVVPSPVLFNDLREGEIIRGGDIPVAPGDPRPATVVAAPKGLLVPSRHEPARVVARFAPVAVEAIDGAWVLDFGKNLAGRIRMRIRGAKAGDVISFRHDERKPPAPRHIDSYIQALPSTNAWKLADAGYQTDRFIAAGVDGETYAPRFTYHGFRYVTVRGLRAQPQISDVAAELIRTDYPVSGSLVTSDATFNKLLDAAVLAYDTNFTDGFPTDCPHREKNGWLGDAAATTTFALYRAGVENALKDWVRTIIDQQRPNGSVPCIVPDFGWEYDGHSCCNSGPAWGTALTTIPARLYELRGDKAFLVEAYPAMKRYCDCVWADLKDGLCDSGLPDWCAAKLLEPGKVWLPRTPAKVSSTAYCYRSHVETAHAAELAGKSDEAKQLRERAEKIRQAFNRAFYRGKGVYHDGWAFGQALALNFGLVEPSEVPAVRRQLVKAVHAENDHIDFGFLGTTVVFRELSKAGESALAYKMIMNDAPSFADWIRHGMTTLCETFPGELSQNHPMFGDFAAWAYEYLAGVQCTAPGFATFRFAPQPIDALDHVTAKVRTPNGDIVAAWQREEGRIVYKLKVPEGCRGLIALPGEQERMVDAGDFTFAIGGVSG